MVHSLGLRQMIVQFVSSFLYDGKGTVKVTAYFDETCWRFTQTSVSTCGSSSS